MALGFEPALANSLSYGNAICKSFRSAKQQEYVIENSDLQNFCEQPLCIRIRREMSAIRQKIMKMLQFPLGRAKVEREILFSEGCGRFSEQERGCFQPSGTQKEGA